MCVDQDKLLYHFLVEGTVIKDGSKVQCDVSLNCLLYPHLVFLKLQVILFCSYNLNNKFG